MAYWSEHYWIVNDNRKPILIHHSDICYPPAVFQQKTEKADISYPGIVTKYGEGLYHLEDGCHRIDKLQESGVYESLFYVLTPEEAAKGMLHTVDVTNKNLREEFIDAEPPYQSKPLSLRKENNKWIAEYGYKTLIIDILPKFPVKVIENACIVDEWERPENPWSYG